MKTTRRNLDELLALTRENRPKGDLLTPDRLLDVVNQAPQGRLRSVPRQLTNRNRTKAMITISGLLITGAMLLYFGLSEPSVQSRRTASPIVANNHAGSKPMPHNIGQQDAGGTTKGDTTPVVGRTSRTDGETNKKNDTVVDRPTTLRKGIRPTNVDARPDVPGIQISTVGRKGLEQRLGIQFDDDSISVDRLEKAAVSDIPDFMREDLRNLGYDLSEDSVAVRMRSSAAIIPDLGSRTHVVAPSNHVTSPSFLGTVAINKQRDGVSLSTAGSHRREELARYGVDVDLFNDELSSLVGMPDTTRQYHALERLVSVNLQISYVPQGSLSGSTYDVFVWFVPDEHFLGALPDQLRRDFLSTLESRVANAKPLPSPKGQAEKLTKTIHPDIMVFAATSATPDDPAPYRSSLRSNLDIDGIRYVDLTMAELARLGVVDRAEKYSIPLRTRLIKPDAFTREALASLGYPPSESDPLVDFDVTADTFELSFRPLNATEERRPIAPVIVSNQWIDTAGRQGMALFVTVNAPDIADIGVADKDLRNFTVGVYDDDNDVDTTTTASLMNRLIPVRFQLTSGEMIEEAGRNRGAEIVLWYVPTDAFIDALPERYAEPLRRELEAITAVEQEGRPSYEVCERVAGERTFLDYCRSSSGAISATQVAPNPISDKATVRYKLDQTRAVSITVHDLAGRYLGTLVEQARRSAGVHEETVDLSEHASGSYLIVIRSDKEERAIQRVIVR